jgi:hypothetical protein
MGMDLARISFVAALAITVACDSDPSGPPAMPTA